VPKKNGRNFGDRPKGQMQRTEKTKKLLSNRKKSSARRKRGVSNGKKEEKNRGKKSIRVNGPKPEDNKPEGVITPTGGSGGGPIPGELKLNSKTKKIKEGKRKPHRSKNNHEKRSGDL